MAEGYQIQRRGVILVKGKGNMETYFVSSKCSENSLDAKIEEPSEEKPSDKSRSLAEMMFNMVQVRKKQTLVGSLSGPPSQQRAMRQARLNLSLRVGEEDSCIDRSMLTVQRSGFRLQRIKSEKPANRKSTNKRKYLSKIRLSDGFADFNSGNFRGTLLDFARSHPKSEEVNDSHTLSQQQALLCNEEATTSGLQDARSDTMNSKCVAMSNDVTDAEGERKADSRICRSVSPGSFRSSRRKNKQIDYL